MTTIATEPVAITEIAEMNVDLVNGVGTPANGTPHLLMKGLGDARPAAKKAAKSGPGGEPTALGIAVKAVTDGKVDEAPDISLARQIMSLLGHAIASEAQEIGAGAYGEVRDVRLLASAADAIATWQSREEAAAAGQDPNAPCGCCSWCSGMGCGCCPGCGYGVIMCSAAEDAVKSGKAINDLPDSDFGYIEDGGEKDDAGKTTPRDKRHFPLHDKKHVQKAVQLLGTSPFGDKAKPKVMAAAKEHGVEVDGDKAGKSTEVAVTGKTVDTSAEGTELSKAVSDALTKALQPVLEGLAAKGTELDGLIAKVKATPIPGGPVMSAAVTGATRGAGADDHAAKAAGYDERAELVEDTDPVLAAGYRKLASQARDKAAAST